MIDPTIKGKSQEDIQMTTLTLNQQLNRIEIKFDAKPIDTTLEELKKLLEIECKKYKNDCSKFSHKKE